MGLNWIVGGGTNGFNGFETNCRRSGDLELTGWGYLRKMVFTAFGFLGYNGVRKAGKLREAEGAGIWLSWW